jgi:hypothetical protein
MHAEISTGKPMKAKYYFLLAIVAFLYCAQQPVEEPAEPILARIGDRVITVSEFKQRADLTLRPFYCRGNSEREKRIVLNSLIAEKLLAFEAGSSSAVYTNEAVKAYVKGRKEQVMRDRLYEIEAVNKVKLDSQQVHSAIQKSGITYDIAFHILDQHQAELVNKELANMPDSASVLFDVIDSEQKSQVRTVKYLDNDIAPIQEALFSKPLSPGYVTAPIRIDEDRYMMMKVVDYKMTPFLSNAEFNKQKKLVQDQLNQNAARAYWDEYVNGVMRGKQIRLNRSTFEELLQQFIVRIEAQQQSELDITAEMNNLMFEENAAKDVNDQPMFQIDDVIWTVAEFRQLVRSRPLVFRDDFINGKRELVHAFRTAILDVIQDHYVTLEAYEQKIDQQATVQHQALIWQDALAAKYRQDDYIDSLRHTPDFDPKKLAGNTATYIDEYVDNLQAKYSAVIHLNRKEFDNITLGSVDMISLRPGMPYTSIVPTFPSNAIDENIEYCVQVD